MIFKVVVVKSSAFLRQRWHVRLVAANGQIVMVSEKYRDRESAVAVAEQMADALRVPLRFETL